MCEKRGKEDLNLERHTREFLKSDETLMLVYPLDFDVFCWWIKRLALAFKRKYGFFDPNLIMHFPWVELNFISLPEETLCTRLLILEEPFGNHQSLLEALLRRRVAGNLKTVIFHSRQPTEYAKALLSLSGVGRRVDLTGWHELL